MAELENKATADGLEGTEAVVQKCEGWFEDSRKFMAKYHERWRKNERLFRNDIQVRLGTADIRFNLALAGIYSELPVIEEYLPTVNVAPKDRDDLQYSDMIQLRIIDLLERADFHDMALDTIADSLQFSNGLCYIEPVFRKVRRDVPADITDGVVPEEGESDNPVYDEHYTGVRISPVSVYTWYPAPGARGMDIRHEAKYHIFATPVHIDDVRMDYGEKGQEVEPEGYLDEFQSFHIVGSGEEGGSDGEKANMVLLKECYFMPGDEEERLKNPNGKVVIWANNVLLDESPLGPDDEELECSCMPYKMVGNYRTPHAIIGIGEPELIATQIGALNQVMSSIADNLNKTGNPQRKVRQSWFVSKLRSVLGRPGEEIVVNNPDDVTWETPPNIPAYTFQFIQTLVQLSDVVTGRHDVMLGKRPAGITAAAAIAELQEAAQKRIRYKLREYNRFVKSCGEYILYIEKKYGEPGTLRKSDEMGDYEFLDYDPDMLRESQMEIRIQSGPGIPGGKLSREARYMEYYKAGLIGGKTFIMNMAEPNKSELLDDYNMRQGIERLAQRQEELNKAFDGFVSLVDKAIASFSGEGNDWEGSTDEMQMADIMKDFPEFLDTDEWRAVPQEAKGRLLEVFMIEPNAGELPAQTDSAGVPAIEQ